MWCMVTTLESIDLRCLLLSIRLPYQQASWDHTHVRGRRDIRIFFFFFFGKGIHIIFGGVEWKSTEDK